MSVTIENRPAVLHDSGNYSTWNALGNEVCYRLKRRDYTVFAGTVYGSNRLQLTMLDAETTDLSVGDQIYISTIDKTAIVTLKIGPIGPTVYFVVDEPYSAAGAGGGYANNLTYRRNYLVQCDLYAYNHDLSRIEVAGTTELYPDARGNVKMVVNTWLEKYLYNRNVNPYTFNNHNDVKAWTKFFLAYRRCWRGYDSEAMVPDQSIPAYGPNVVLNSSLTDSSNHWVLIGCTWSNQIYSGRIKKDSAFTAKAYPSNYGAYPTLAGETWTVCVEVVEQSGTVSGTSWIRMYFDDIGLAWSQYQDISLPGKYTLDFVAVVDGVFPTISFQNTINGSVKNITAQRKYTAAGTRWHHINRGSCQLRPPYLNQADHTVFYDTIASEANRAKFMCDFEEPTYYPGYPFDLAILFDPSMRFITTTKKEEIYDVNVATGINSEVLVPVVEGENRIMLTGSYAATVPSIKVWLEVGSYVPPGYVVSGYVNTAYVENDGSTTPSGETGPVTEKRKVRIGNVCLKNLVYVAWKGAEGGWSYYMFSFDHGLGITTNDIQVAAPYLESLNAEENLIKLSGDSQPSITLGADNIDENDYNGLLKMLESERVTIYRGNDAKYGHVWETIIIKPGSWKRTKRATRYDIEFTADLPFRYTNKA